MECVKLVKIVSLGDVMENKTTIKNNPIVIKEGFCAFCGCKISFRDDFPKNCKEYCCVHCPDAKKTPCERDEQDGGFFNVLSQF